MLGSRLKDANRIARKRLRNMYWWRHFSPNRFRKQRNYTSSFKSKMPGRKKSSAKKRTLGKESNKTKRDYFYLQDAMVDYESYKSV